MTMKFKANLEKTGNSHIISIPEDIALDALEKIGKRILLKVNNHVSIHCAILRTNAIGYYIMAGKSTRTKMKAEAGDELSLEILKDDSTYKAAVSEELKEVLLTDPDGQNRFEQLTDGKKRSIIHYVNKAKQSATRIDRALKIVDNLKSGATDLKELLR